MTLAEVKVALAGVHADHGARWRAANLEAEAIRVRAEIKRLEERLASLEASLLLLEGVEDADGCCGPDNG